MKSAQIENPNPQPSKHRLIHRAAFTLVELLIVIVVIGILIGLLAVALGPTITTAREFAVTTEIRQLDLGIENFRNKYGFYPPSFVGLGADFGTDPTNVDATNGIVDPGDENALLPFLNKISPNHRELDPMFPGTTTPSRLRVWWVAIGRHLDDRGSLVFWLNGLSANKQFPITGGLPLVGGNAQLPVIFNADLAIEVDSDSNRQTGEVPIVGAFERETRFDFRGSQLSDQFFFINTTGSGPPTGLLPTPAGIRVYNMPFGNQQFDLAYRYRNAAFYPAASAGVAALHVNTDGGPVFLNPGKFQIVTLGFDGRASGFASSQINPPSSGDADEREDWVTFNSDNIANFADGRLDNFDWSESVELGGGNPQ